MSIISLFGGGNIMKKFSARFVCICLIISICSVQIYAADNQSIVKDDDSIYRYSSKIYSASIDDVGLLGDAIPVADNINLFRSSAPSGYYQQWSEGSTLSGLANGYGVVSLYRNETTRNIVYLEMNSNIRAYDFYKGLTTFEWEVSNDKSYKGVTITNWNPKGTTEATYGGFPVTIEVPIKGVNVGTTINLFENKTTLTGYAGESYYNVKLESNTPINGDKVQELCAYVAYDTQLAGTTWTWKWSWEVKK